MSDTTDLLTDAAFVNAFLDVIVPPSDDGRMPGASALGIAEAIADRIGADPMLGAAVRAGMQAVQDAALARDPGGFLALDPTARAEVAQSQAPAHPALMLGVAAHLYQAYYQHPQVIAALGYPARTPFPEGYPLEPTDPALMESLLRRAKAAT